MAELFNVAKGKKVNALGSNTAAITDGITEAGVHWDGGVAPAQAIVDLGGYYRITAATLTTYYGDGRAYRFALYAGVRSSGMTLLYEQKTDEEATAEGYKMTFSAVVARYVKVVMLHNTANPSVHIADLAVYGEECPEYKEEAETAPKADPEDLAYGKPTRANVNDAFSFLVTDGDPESCWLGELYPRFVDVDLLDNYQLSRVVLTAPAFAGFDYSLYLSADGVNFEKAGAVTTTEKKTEAELALEGKTARVLRVLCTGTTQGANGASGLCQVKAYGKKAGGEVLPTRKIIEMTTYEEWLRERENVDLSKLKDEKGQYNIQDTYTPADTVRALEGLIGRILGQMYVDWFVFLIDRSMRKNSYELSETENGKILIHADCGVSAATALNFYLKYYCKVQVTQQTKQVRMPEKAPHIAEKVCNSSPYEVRYAYNYCTLSYTMPFFGYDKWQRELDYLMLSGVNLILDLTGGMGLLPAKTRLYGRPSQGLCVRLLLQGLVADGQPGGLRWPGGRRMGFGYHGNGPGESAVYDGHGGAAGLGDLCGCHARELRNACKCPSEGKGLFRCAPLYGAARTVGWRFCPSQCAEDQL